MNELRRRTVNEEAAVPRVADVRVVDRLAQGLHVRVRLTDGRVRAAWVADEVLRQALGTGVQPNHVVAPTDGGPPLQVFSQDILNDLISQGVRDASASFDRPAPPRTHVPRRVEQALALSVVGFMALAAGALAVGLLVLLG